MRQAKFHSLVASSQFLAPGIRITGHLSHGYQNMIKLLPGKAISTDLLSNKQAAIIK